MMQLLFPPGMHVGGNSDGFQPLSVVADRRTSALIRLATLCYVLRTFPVLLWTMSIPGWFAVFVIGVAVGSVIVAGCVGVLLWGSFERKPGSTDNNGQKCNAMAKLHSTAEAEAQEAASAAAKPTALNLDKLPSHQEIEALVQSVPESLSNHNLHEIILGAAMAGVPVPLKPPIATGGNFEGILWVCGPDKYEIGSGLLDKWPPMDEGPDPMTTCWHAVVIGGALTLRRLRSTNSSLRDENDQNDRGRSGGVQKFGPLDSYSPEIANNATKSWPEVVVIPLSGLKVSCVKEGLGLKSEWSKRAPLRLDDLGGGDLVHGHSTLFLWAVSGAFKEQWRNALLRGASLPNVCPLATFELAYRSFSEEAARLTLEHPEVYHIEGLEPPPVQMTAAEQRRAARDRERQEREAQRKEKGRERRQQREKDDRERREAKEQRERKERSSTAQAASGNGNQRTSIFASSSGTSAAASVSGRPPLPLSPVVRDSADITERSQAADEAQPPARWWRPKNLARRAFNIGVKGGSAAVGVVVRNATRGGSRRTSEAGSAAASDDVQVGNHDNGDAIHRLYDDHLGQKMMGDLPREEEKSDGATGGEAVSCDESGREEEGVEKEIAADMGPTVSVIEQESPKAALEDLKEDMGCATEEERRAQETLLSTMDEHWMMTPPNLNQGYSRSQARSGSGDLTLRTSDYDQQVTAASPAGSGPISKLGGSTSDADNTHDCQSPVIADRLKPVANSGVEVMGHDTQGHEKAKTSPLVRDDCKRGICDVIDISEGEKITLLQQKAVPSENSWTLQQAQEQAQEIKDATEQAFSRGAILARKREQEPCKMQDPATHLPSRTGTTVAVGKNHLASSVSAPDLQPLNSAGDDRSRTGKEMELSPEKRLSMDIERSSHAENNEAQGHLRPAHPSPDAVQSQADTEQQPTTGSPVKTGPLPEAATAAYGVSSQPDQDAEQDDQPEQTVRPSSGSQLSALNTLLTRIAYDLLRSQRVQAMLTSRVEKLISDIKTPPYISGGLRLVDLNLGKSPPVITGLSAEPSPPDCIVPMLNLQVAYRGDFSLTLETFLDPREAAGWSRLDKALSSLQGGGDHGREEAGGVDFDPSETGTSNLNIKEHDRSNDTVPEAGTLPEDGPSPSDGKDFHGKPQSPSSKATGGGGRKGNAFLNVRQAAAARARRFVERMGEYISRVPLRLHVKVSHLHGTIRAWVPPPPTDRLWYAFQEEPTMIITARPDVGGHQLKYMGVASRVSTWVAAKLRTALTNTLVFPSCVDLKLRFLMGMAAEASSEHCQPGRDQYQPDKGTLPLEPQEVRLHESQQRAPLTPMESMQPEAFVSRHVSPSVLANEAGPLDLGSRNEEAIEVSGALLPESPDRSASATNNGRKQNEAGLT